MITGVARVSPVGQGPSLHRPAARRGPVPRRGHDLTPMALSLCVGLCTLPFVFLMVTPWLGARAALSTGLVVLGAITVLCWALCAAGRPPHLPAGFRGWGTGRRGFDALPGERPSAGEPNFVTTNGKALPATDTLEVAPLPDAGRLTKDPVTAAPGERDEIAFVAEEPGRWTSTALSCITRPTTTASRAASWWRCRAAGGGTRTRADRRTAAWNGRGPIPAHRRRGRRWAEASPEREAETATPRSRRGCCGGGGAQ